MRFENNTFIVLYIHAHFNREYEKGKYTCNGKKHYQLLSVSEEMVRIRCKNSDLGDSRNFSDLTVLLSL